MACRHFFSAGVLLIVGIFTIQNCGSDRSIAIGDALSTGDIATTAASALCAKAEECGELRIDYTSKYSSYSYTCMFDCGDHGRGTSSSPPQINPGEQPNGGSGGGQDGSSPNNTDTDMPYPNDAQGEWRVTRQPVNYADCFAEMKADLLHGMARRKDELSAPERQLLTDCINGITANTCVDPQAMQTALENRTSLDRPMPPACRYMDEMFGGSIRNDQSSGGSGTMGPSDPDNTSTPDSSNSHNG